MVGPTRFSPVRSGVAKRWPPLAGSGPLMATSGHHHVALPATLAGRSSGEPPVAGKPPKTS